jgi:tetratricopeptide (TPR) repeat protein
MRYVQMVEDSLRRGVLMTVALRTSYGHGLWQAGYADAAIAVFERHIEFVPDDKKARMTLAAFLEERGNPYDARVQYVEILKRDPLDFYAHRALGMNYLDKNETGKARAHLDIADSFQAADSGALITRARLEVMEGNFSEAEKLLKQVKPINSDDVLHEIVLTHVLINADKPDEAVVVAQNTLARAKERKISAEGAHYAYAKALYMADRKPESYTYLRQRLQQSDCSNQEVILFLAHKGKAEPLLPVFRARFGDEKVQRWLEENVESIQENYLHFMKDEWWGGRTNAIWNDPQYWHDSAPVNGMAAAQMSDLPAFKRYTLGQMLNCE